VRVKLKVEYEGTRYSGWQLQKGQRSVQQVIEETLQILFKKQIRITAAGRTDAGVHARNQVVHFDSPEYDLRKLQRSLNGMLEKDIVVKECIRVRDDFHARFDATARYYSYRIAMQPTALWRNYAWPVFFPLNLTLLQRGAELIPRYEDFQAFCKVKSEVKHYLCQVYNSYWSAEEYFLIYHIVANRFLHGMVRALVGTLISLGRGKISIHDMKKMIEGKDRTRVPLTAPARGLILEQVYYGKELNNEIFY